MVRSLSLSLPGQSLDWGQKEENGAGHGESEWSGLETNTQAGLLNRLHCQLSVSR